MAEFALLLLALGPILDLGACEREPLILEYASWYYDGGSLGVALTDSSGCLVEFCFDHGIGSATRGRILVGSRRPSDARLASDTEEQAVLRLVREVLNRAYPEIVQQEFMEMESRGSIPEEDYRAWLLLRELRSRGEKAVNDSEVDR